MDADYMALKEPLIDPRTGEAKFTLNAEQATELGIATEADYEGISFDPEEIESEIQEASDDPRQQMFFLRLDCKRVVKTEAEYKRLVGEVPMTVVTYNVAIQIEREAAAKETKKKKAQKARKAARATRRANR